MVMPALKPMLGRPDRRNCETTENQSAGGKRGGRQKLDAIQLDALWDEVIAHRVATFKWTPPPVGDFTS